MAARCYATATVPHSPARHRQLMRSAHLTSRPRQRHITMQEAGREHGARPHLPSSGRLARTRGRIHVTTGIAICNRALASRSGHRSRPAAGSRSAVRERARALRPGMPASPYPRRGPQHRPRPARPCGALPEIRHRPTRLHSARLSTDCAGSGNRIRFDSGRKLHVVAQRRLQSVPCNGRPT